jgi:hypothetical protein
VLARSRVTQTASCSRPRQRQRQSKTQSPSEGQRRVLWVVGRAFPASALATTTANLSTATPSHCIHQPRSTTIAARPSAMANKGSFAQRMASMAPSIENWDDDADFDAQGDLFAHSMSTIQSTTSSRISVRSDSNIGDDDWQVLITPNNELSTLNAITSAKHAGIPIPRSVPSSALLGGSIKRLGKKNSNRKIAADDDWANDLELPTNTMDGGLKLKVQLPAPSSPGDDFDDLEDWGEGSLGIRFGGTRREARGARSSSVSAMSPSMGSCMTVESEDDDLSGLVLPQEQLNFSARLERLKKAEHLTPDSSPVQHQQRHRLSPTSAPPLAPSVEFTSSASPAQSVTPPLERELWPEARPESRPNSQPKPTVDEEDFLDGLDFGSGEALDTQKLTLNRNVVVKKTAPKKPVAPPAARPATTITFTDKPSVSRIPRPLPSTASRTRLTPLYEAGAPPTTGHSRPMPTTTSAQLLRAKRSAPVLRNAYGSISRAPLPFLPAGNSTSQSHHVAPRSSQPHMRQNSDSRRPPSPSMRTYSRLSANGQPDTPSRAGMRRDQPSAASARQPKVPQKISQPLGPKKVFGVGNELDGFDDLPTSATKEKQFEKVPRNVPSNKSLRHQTSNARMPLPDRMATPQPQTPRSPTRPESTPRFARDTAASRIAREQRVADMRSRGDGSIVPNSTTNWKAQVAARSPHASPTAHRKRGSFQKPTLIKAMSQPIPKSKFLVLLKAYCVYTNACHQTKRA